MGSMGRIIIIGLLMLLSACASKAPLSIAELEAKAPNDFNGKVQSTTINRSFPSVLKQVAERVDNCLSYSYKWYQNGVAAEKWVYSPKLEKKNRDKARIYIETEYTDYGFVSDDVQIQYNFMIDIDRVSKNQTRVTTYLINYMKWGDAIIGHLEGDKDAYCPAKKNNNW